MPLLKNFHALFFCSALAAGFVSTVMAEDAPPVALKSPTALDLGAMCDKFVQIEQNELNQMIRDLKNRGYAADDYFLKAGCKPEKVGGAKVPMIHLVAEAPCTRVDYPVIIHKYYTVKRKDQKLWEEVVNAKNTNGETYLDYIETMRLKDNYLISTSINCANQLITFACETGGKYSKVPLSCNPEENPAIVASFKLGAAQGDKLATKNLGWAYEHGELGLSIDMPKALALYAKLAEQGDVDTQRTLADLLESAGDGPEAIKWLKKINDAAAYYDMAEIYYDGVGMEKDKALAYKAWEKSYDMGGWYALTKMAEQYTTDGNYAAALSWYQRRPSDWYTHDNLHDADYEADFTVGLLYFKLQDFTNSTRRLKEELEKHMKNEEALQEDLKFTKGSYIGRYFKDKLNRAGKVLKLTINRQDLLNVWRNQAKQGNPDAEALLEAVKMNNKYFKDQW